MILSQGSIDSLLIAVSKSGFYERKMVSDLRTALDFYTVAKDLGVIKKCHYAVIKNEINFYIKQLTKELEKEVTK